MCIAKLLLYCKGSVIGAKLHSKMCPVLQETDCNRYELFFRVKVEIQTSMK